MSAHVTKWGNSYGIRIPKPLGEQTGMTEGVSVKLEVKNGCLIVRKAHPTLDQLLSKINDKNIHPETSTGTMVGHEKW